MQRQGDGAPLPDLVQRPFRSPGAEVRGGPVRVVKGGAEYTVSADISARIFAKLTPTGLLKSPWWCPSYIGDYLVLLLLLLGPIFLVDMLVEPIERRYYMPPMNGTDPAWADNVFSLPYKESESYPTWGVFTMGIGLPLLVIAGVTFARRRSVGVHLFHNGFMACAAAVVVGYSIQVPVQRTIGHIKPDFMERLLSGDEELIKAGRATFPAGLTTFSFASLGSLSLFIAGQLRLFHPANGHLWRVVVTLLPLIAAFAQGVTRIVDYRHHPVDAVAGAIIGILSALMCYTVYFPPHWSHTANDPLNRKRPRIVREAPQEGFARSARRAVQVPQAATQDDHYQPPAPLPISQAYEYPAHLSPEP